MATSSLLFSLSKSKLFSSLPLSITRRGYAASAAQVQVGAGLGRGGCMSSTVVGSKVEDQRAVINGSEASSEASNAWAPDPLTGYYRPANRVDEIDPVELRQMLLNHKVNKPNL